MTATPTITRTGVASGGYNQLLVTNTDSPARNEIWRATPTENSGLAFRIASSLPANYYFYDYHVASGKTYSYYAVAVDSAGVQAVSSITAGSLTLLDLWIHVVSRTVSDRNISGTALSLYNQQSYNVNRGRVEVEFNCAGRTSPLINAAPIVDRSLRAQARIPEMTVVTLTLLETIFNQKKMVCVRDQRGNKIFGILQELPVTFQDTLKDIDLTVLETDYTESV